MNVVEEGEIGDLGEEVSNINAVPVEKHKPLEINKTSKLLYITSGPSQHSYFADNQQMSGSVTASQLHLKKVITSQS